MSELGELLELLHTARRRVRTARGLLYYRYSRRLAQEAFRREHERPGRGSSMQYTTVARRSGPEPPDLHEERTRFWWQPPDRLREETGERTIVHDGGRWWLYSPELGARSNAGLAPEEAARHGAGGGERLRSLLDPSLLPAVVEFSEPVADGRRWRVPARPRDDLDDVLRHVHSPWGADELEVEVDRDTGVLHRIAYFLGGEELAVTELEELVLDEELPPETFVFVPPPGEEVRPPDTVAQHELSLEQVAERASFPVFAVPELPEGHWRLHVHYHGQRERPPVAESAALIYHRADGRGALIVSERGDEGEQRLGWAGVHPDGPPVETVERGGVRYLVLRGESERGAGAQVAFERDGTQLQLRSQELDVETLLELAASLRRV